MQKKFELWLDESGEFYKEKDKRRENKLPSLIGGFLVPVEKVTSVLNTVFMDEERNHAMYLGGDEKREYVLPLLQSLVHEHGLSMVFFENTQYEDAPSNRQLYLQLMAEGILQLLQKLDGLYESVDLAVWIAQRRDVHVPNPERQRIDETEYIAMLGRIMEQKRKQRRILLNENTKVHFVVRPAHREVRLQCADFACNTRLTRFSETFASVRSEVERLYDTAHLFDLHESSSENYIKICMEKGDVADAIMELFTTWEMLDRTEQLEYVMKGMQNYSRQQREVVLSQCLAEIETHLYHQEDYALGEAFLKELLEQLVPCLDTYGMLDMHFQFKLRLLLVEQSIKIGNLVSARTLLGQCKSYLEGEVKCIEDAWDLCSKEALLLFGEGKFAEAEELMRKVCESRKRVQEAKQQDDLLTGMHVKLDTEEYVSALCLYIYILLPRQSEAGMYQKLCGLLQEAMATDSVKYERLTRYRSLVEAKEGHIKEALKWLLDVQSIEEDYTGRMQLGRYLKELQLRRDSRDIQFGVMYYLAIMDEAAKLGSAFARMMYGVFSEQKALLEYLGMLGEEAELPNEVDTSAASEKDSAKLYHPMEQIYTYYASYLAQQGNREEANKWLSKAEMVEGLFR